MIGYLYTRVYVYMPISIYMDNRKLTKVRNAMNIINTIIRTPELTPLYLDRMLIEAWENLNKFMEEDV